MLSIPGEQMESVHQQRQRAQAAYDLIQYYNQFSRDDTTRLDALRKDGRDGRRQVAVLLRRLSTVAKEVDLPHAEKVSKTYEFSSLITEIDGCRPEKTSIATARSSRRTCYIYSIVHIVEGIPR